MVDLLCSVDTISQLRDLHYVVLYIDMLLAWILFFNPFVFLFQLFFFSSLFIVF